MPKFVFAAEVNVPNILDVLGKNGFNTDKIELFDRIFKYADLNLAEDYKRYSVFVIKSILFENIFGDLGQTIKACVVIFYILLTCKFRKPFPGDIDFLTAIFEKIYEEDVSLIEAIPLIFDKDSSKIKKVSQLKKESGVKKLVLELHRQFPDLFPKIK